MEVSQTRGQWNPTEMDNWINHAITPQHSPHHQAKAHGAALLRRSHRALLRCCVATVVCCLFFLFLDSLFRLCFLLRFASLFIFLWFSPLLVVLSVCFSLWFCFYFFLSMSFFLCHLFSLSLSLSLHMSCFVFDSIFLCFVACLLFFCRCCCCCSLAESNNHLQAHQRAHAMQSFQPRHWLSQSWES